MAHKLVNRSLAYVASFDGDRSMTKSNQLANLRQRGQEWRSMDILGRLFWAVGALVNDLSSFLTWHPKSTSMCANYGHVFDRRQAGYGNRCSECGDSIESLDDLRGYTSPAHRQGIDSRSVIRW